MSDGELSVVLRTHMPYVEGFGTSPFGEEWLWERIATSYLPLLELLEQAPGADRLTLSLTPVLCDQLEAPGAIERCLAFLTDVRERSHALDVEALRRDGDLAAAAELERSAADYARAARSLERLQHEPGAGLSGALGLHASWTSAATHAVLPLIATDDGLRLQLEAGIAAHRHRYGDGWDGGFWLPECAYAEWLAAPLEDTGVRVSCIELTNVYGVGSEAHLRPRRTDEGPLLVPIDRSTIDLVCGEGGYLNRPAYRARGKLTAHHHWPWANDGQVYDRERAAEQTQRDAHDFVERVSERLERGGLCVLALDSELLGHRWFEGPQWLAAVLAEAQGQGLNITRLDAAAAERHAPTPLPAGLPPSSWGEGNDLRAWSNAKVADLATRARSVELRTFAVGGSVQTSRRALRELLALQSSDWAFMASRGCAGEYPRVRADGHAATLELALAGAPQEPYLRNLAPWLGA